MCIHRLFRLVCLLCLGSVRVSLAEVLVLAPAETTVTVGDSFVLRAVIDSAPDVKGAELVYGYTPGHITFLSGLAGGAMLGSGGTTFDFVVPDSATPPDSAWFETARLDGTGSGPGVVAFLHFQSHTQGNASVNCLSTDLRDSGNVQLPVVCAGALVHVIGPVPVRPTSWTRVKSLYR